MIQAMTIGEFIDGLDGIERALIIAILYITAVTIIIVAEYGRNRK
jgi:hypothetical protein